MVIASAEKLAVELVTCEIDAVFGLGTVEVSEQALIILFLHDFPRCRGLMQQLGHSRHLAARLRQAVHLDSFHASQEQKIVAEASDELVQVLLHIGDPITPRRYLTGAG